MAHMLKILSSDETNKPLCLYNVLPVIRRLWKKCVHHYGNQTPPDWLKKKVSSGFAPLSTSLSLHLK